MNYVNKTLLEFTTTTQELLIPSKAIHNNFHKFEHNNLRNTSHFVEQSQTSMQLWFVRRLVGDNTLKKHCYAQLFY